MDALTPEAGAARVAIKTDIAVIGAGQAGYLPPITFSAGGSSLAAALSYSISRRRQAGRGNIAGPR